MSEVPLQKRTGTRGTPLPASWFLLKSTPLETGRDGIPDAQGASNLLHVQ